MNTCFRGLTFIGVALISLSGMGVVMGDTDGCTVGYVTSDQVSDCLPYAYSRPYRPVNLKPSQFPVTIINNTAQKISVYESETPMLTLAKQESGSIDALSTSTNKIEVFFAYPPQPSD